MLTAGVICEFDPFHNGHAYLFEKIRQDLGAQRIVCVMSGAFTQRGAISGWDKFDRARAAVCCGADLVIELPFAYAVSSADYFARGGVRMLGSLGCATHLAFGSETGDLESLKRSASAFSDAPAQKTLKEALESGLPFPKAAAQAAGSDAPAGPNDILALCYLRAIKDLGSDLIPFAVKREGAGHGESTRSGRYASASEIRSSCRLTGSLGSCSDLMPKAAFDILSAELFAGTTAEEKLFTMIVHAALTKSPAEIAACPEVSEGLENRIKDAVQSAADLDGLVKAVKSKRYTYARISRALIQLLCGLTKTDMAAFEKERTAYAKVLAFGPAGADILREASENGAEIISNINKYIPKDDAAARMLGLDILSQDIFSIAAGRTINQFSDKVRIPKLIDLKR